jgi:hypothetical protein
MAINSEWTAPTPEELERAQQDDLKKTWVSAVKLGWSLGIQAVPLIDDLNAVKAAYLAGEISAIDALTTVVIPTIRSLNTIKKQQLEQGDWTGLIGSASAASGLMVFDLSTMIEASDDAAAATAGAQIGQVYRDNSTLKIRIS